MIKKADVALFFIILTAGLILSYVTLISSKDGQTVRITAGGELYGVYSLEEDREIPVVQNGHTNNIIIKDGTVSMDYSDCKNQVCVNTGAISQTRDSIACLPNKVLIEIEAEDEGGDVDVITG